MESQGNRIKISTHLTRTVRKDIYPRRKSSQKAIWQNTFLARIRFNSLVKFNVQLFEYLLRFWYRLSCKYWLCELNETRYRVPHSKQTATNTSVFRSKNDLGISNFFQVKEAGNSFHLPANRCSANSLFGYFFVEDICLCARWGWLDNFALVSKQCAKQS